MAGEGNQQATGPCCKGGHGALKLFQTEQDGYGCDGCGSRVPRGTDLWGCRECPGGYDLCRDCLQAQSQCGPLA